MRAIRDTSTVRLADRHRQSMEFIEELAAILCCILLKRLGRQFYQGIVSAAVAPGSLSKQVVALGDAAEVLVGNREWVAERVEQYRVCCFRPNAWKRQQSRAHHGCR